MPINRIYILDFQVVQAAPVSLILASKAGTDYKSKILKNIN